MQTGRCMFSATSMEHDIPFGNSNRENGTTFLDFPLFLGILQWDEPTKRVPFTDEPEIPEILTKWKAPGVYDQMEQLFTNRKFHFCYHRNFRVFFVNGKRPWPDPLVQRLSCGAYLRVNNISVSCAPIWFSFSFFLSPSLPSFRFFSNTVRHCLENCQDIFSAFCSIRFFKGVTTLLHCEALLGA